MADRNPRHPFPHLAPILLGAILCSCASLLSSCKDQGHTPTTATATAATPVAPTPADQASTPPQPAPAATTPQTPPSTAPKTGLRFVAYNLENWLTMDRVVNGKTIPQSPKPESEKAACVRILAKAQPDVLGICEIGTRDDAADLQSRLKTAGLDLPHLHFTGGADETRHLALLSRFPLTPHDPGPLTYRLESLEFGMQRGILDASLSADGREFRFLGVHLKSKREVEEGSQEQMRRNESHLLRRHVEQLLAQNPQARLVVYGDFNDTRQSSPLRGVQGPYKSPLYLTPLPLADSRGHFWTHHWKFQDVYSRFDYIMVSQPLKPDVDFKASRILDDASWDEASDHRAVLAIFR